MNKLEAGQVFGIIAPGRSVDIAFVTTNSKGEKIVERECTFNNAVTCEENDKGLELIEEEDIGEYKIQPIFPGLRDVLISEEK